MSTDLRVNGGRAMRHWAGVAALLLSAAAYAALVIFDDPLVLLYIVLASISLAGGVYLFQRPISALYVAVFALLFPYGLRPIEFDFAYTVAMNSAVLLGLLAWTYQAIVRNEAIVWNNVFLIWALYMLWASFSLLWAPDIVLGRKVIVGYILGLILLFLIIQQVRSIEAIDGLLRTVFVIGWIIMIAGLIALATHYEPGVRLKILDMNENTIGVYTMISLPAVMWPVIRNTGLKRTIYMWLSVAFILIGSVLILASGSRGSLISLMIILAACWLAKPLRPWGILGVAMLGCVLISAPFLIDLLSVRAEESWGNELGARDLLWQATLMLIGDQPFSGSGVGNGRIALAPYIGSLTAAFADRNNLPSHNPLLEVGADTGVLGMAIYAGIAISALRQFFRCRARWSMSKGPFASYFPIVMASGAGFFASFVKDGGMENHPTYVLMLALLTIPSGLAVEGEKLPHQKGTP